jgi:hypothetical protein
MVGTLKRESTMSLRSTFRAIAFAILCAGASLAAPRAQRQYEHILDYHSDLTLQADGTLLVRETIRVFATGNQIRHGIYRDFPTRYTDRLGSKYVVGFDVTDATCDDSPVPFRVEDYSNGKRIYLGDKNTFIPGGDHIYTISYTTNRQLGFFADHDELFWNVTGNGWGFELDHASATVRLPENIPAGEVRLSGYTGPQGSLAQDLTTSTEDGAFQFAANGPLRPYSGLTILLAWPKGYIAPPTVEQRLTWFLHDNSDALVLAAALLLLLVYYYVVWSAVGRDPQRGVIMPLYEPPAELSPAAMRYLVRMGFDNKTFATAVLDMAVRGYITIKEDAGVYQLRRTNADARVLSPDERALADSLLGSNQTIWLQNINHTVISGAIHTLQSWLKTAEEKIYFFTNSRYMVPGLILSAIGFISGLALRGGPSLLIGAFLCVWLTGWSIAVAGLLYGVAQKWKAAFTAPKGAALQAGGALFLSLFALPFLAGEAFGLFMLVKSTSWLIAEFLFINVGVHILFHFLLKAPTSAGRRLLDKVEGFKLFLGEVEGDRLNRVMPPDQTPQTFEKFLPYALALDVEQAWAKKFSSVLAAAGHAPGGNVASYTPSFYSGAAWNGFGASGFASSFGDSFTSAISSSASAPGSSSGGGGGGSGGGGGGGGGGGW